MKKNRTKLKEILIDLSLLIGIIPLSIPLYETIDAFLIEEEKIKDEELKNKVTKIIIETILGSITDATTIGIINEIAKEDKTK